MNYLLEKRKKSAIQLFRYGLIGLVSNIAGYVVYLLITYLGGTPKITMSILYGVGASISFFGNRKFTFADKSNLLLSGLKYLFAHLVGYLINLTILIIMVDNLGYDHRWVQAIAIIVVASFLFITFKYFVFTQPGSSNTDSI